MLLLRIDKLKTFTPISILLSSIRWSTTQGEIMAEENLVFSGISVVPVTRQELVATAATVGAVVGASMALFSRTVSGAASVPVITAAAAAIVAVV